MGTKTRVGFLEHETLWYVDVAVSVETGRPPGADVTTHGLALEGVLELC